MSNPKEAPKRRFTLEITIDADSEDDLCHALDEFSLKVACRDIAEGPGLSAAWAWSWLYRLTERKGQTGDQYRIELEKWRLENDVR